jgi:hypothetical protein
MQGLYIPQKIRNKEISSVSMYNLTFLLLEPLKKVVMFKKFEKYIVILMKKCTKN